MVSEVTILDGSGRTKPAKNARRPGTPKRAATVPRTTTISRLNLLFMRTDYGGRSPMFQSQVYESTLYPSPDSIRKLLKISQQIFANKVDIPG
jgi:hypothetical protein